MHFSVVLAGSIELHRCATTYAASGLCFLEKVIFLDILEVFISAVLQFVGGIFITDDDGMGMLLQAADGPHVVDRLFYTVTKGAGLVVTIHHDHHLLGIHHGTDSDGQSCLGNQVDIIIEETTISNHGICGERFLTGAALQAGAWLVEGDVAVGTDTTHEQVDAACCLNSFLVVLALCFQILGIAIEDMYILFLDVNVTEEVVPHEAVVALGMFLGEVHVLVHVERDHILERYLASLVQGNQFSVHA